MGRLKVNFKAVNDLLKDPGTVDLVSDITQDIEKATNAGTKREVTVGPQRVRGAVIAGYEDGATAESTRDALLRALDAGKR